MLATLLSATLIGLDGRVIRVEVDVAPGLPGFTIVGLADASVREARERVRGAIRNAGFIHPPRRITVNLAPADLPKKGPSADLAIAIGILAGSEQFTARAGRAALIGELSLGGEVRAVPGVLPMVAALARRGVGRVLVPAATADEARLVPGVDVIAVASLSEAVDALRSRQRARPKVPARVELATASQPPMPGDEAIHPRATGPIPMVAGPTAAALGAAAAVTGLPAGITGEHPDLAEVRGQIEARRALEVALSGGHGLLLIGPPGTGKTLLARTIPGLLPPLGDREALAATIVASVSGEGPISELVREAPFRSPHHTSSYAAMVGGGPWVSPGEVTRADHGVLFLDELAEFSRDVLEALRQPLEDGRISIARTGRTATLPARFQLVAAMNPCPCGNAGGEPGACSCPPGLPDRYVGRISGPLRDRIDIWVGMPRVAAHVLLSNVEPESSSVVGSRVAAARLRQLSRPGSTLNARVSGRALRAIARLTPATQHHLVGLSELERLSGRGTERLLRVARTIADLAEADRVEPDHLDEAARWRIPSAHPLTALAV